MSAPSGLWSFSIARDRKKEIKATKSMAVLVVATEVLFLTIRSVLIQGSSPYQFRCTIGESVYCCKIAKEAFFHLIHTNLSWLSEIVPGCLVWHHPVPIRLSRPKNHPQFVVSRLSSNEQPEILCIVHLRRWNGQASMLSKSGHSYASVPHSASNL